MNSKDITSIALKFFGIYLMVNLVFSIPTMVAALTTVSTFGSDQLEPGSIVLAVGVSLILGMGVSFVIFRLANSISAQATDSVEPTQSLFQEFLLQVLGVFFIVSSITVAPDYVIMLLVEKEPETSKLFYGLGHVFRAAVGCYLLVKPVVWRQWLDKARGR